MPSAPLIDRFAEEVLTQWPQLRLGNVSVVAAVSGGADSVAMLRILHHIFRKSHDETPRNPRLWIAHFNHRLRGEASDGDQTFVENLAEELSLNCLVGSSAHSSNLPKGSEDRFRRERYAFLDQQSHRIGARYVSVAHSADDQVETVLHQLLRGSSLTGLSGIPRARPLGKDVVLFRPVLSFRGCELRGLLDDLGQSWREDATNRESDYQRNWLRNQLLPSLRERYADPDAAILRASQTATIATDHLNRLAEEWTEKHTTQAPPDRVVLRKTTPTDSTPWDRLVAIQALSRLWDLMEWPRRDMTQHHWDQIWKMFATGFPLVHNLPGGLRASVTTECVVVERTVGD